MRSTYEIKASFSARIAGTTERRDGTSYDWAYDVIPYAPPEYNVAVYREDEGIIRELHLLNGRGQWSGPSATIYLPEVGYEGARRDRDEAPYVVKPAHCGASATGSTDTTGIRAQARMLELAAEYADALTLESHVRLQTEADLKNADWRHERSERERLGALRRERQERRAEVLRQAQDHVVRVSAGDGSPWRVGTLRVADDAHGITVLARDGEHEFSLGHDREPCVEVKQPNGRYQTLMTGTLEVVA